MRFSFYIIEVPSGSVVGTNDAATAELHAQDDNTVVIDADNGMERTIWEMKRDIPQQDTYFLPT